MEYSSTELVDWSAFTEQDFEKLKECAVSHTECDEMTAPMLDSQHGDLQIEFRVKPLGSEWVLDADAYSSTDEIMTPVIGYTEDVLPALTYDNMKSDVETGLREELGLAKSSRCQNSIER